MIDLANERGGEDNISVVVISVETDPAQPAEAEMATANNDDDDTLLLKDRAAFLQEQEAKKQANIPDITEVDTAESTPLNNHAPVSPDTENEGRDPLVPDQ